MAISSNCSVCANLQSLDSFEGALRPGDNHSLNPSAAPNRVTPNAGTEAIRGLRGRALNMANLIQHLVFVMQRSEWKVR